VTSTASASAASRAAARKSSACSISRASARSMAWKLKGGKPAMRRSSSWLCAKLP
jgi:hypothetical protein